jgi:tetratricopeptide (TPR) repeat protein
MIPLFWHRGISCLLLAAAAAYAQNPPATGAAEERTGKAAAYYNYSLGHLYSELAGAYGNRGDYFNKAVESYRAALKADPSATFISEELSELYIQSGRLRDAVSEAEDTLKQNPQDLNARRVLARIYTRLIGDTQQNHIDESMVKKAIEQYEAITAKEPKDAESWMMLGRLQKMSQNSTESVKAYQKALEADPDNEDAMTGLAMVYADLGDTKAAAGLLKKATEKDPNPRSLAALASAYEQMKDYPLAAETLRRALDQQPGNAEIKKALAQDLLFADQLDEALKLYNEAVADDAKDEQSLLRISQIYRQKREFAKAREAAEKAKELDPNNLEIRYNDVTLLESEGKAPEAIKALKGILESTEKKTYTASERANRTVLLERLGYLYRTNEQYTEAVGAFREIGAMDPDAGARAAAQVVDTYRLAKQFSKAESEADAAAKKFPDDRAVRSVRASLWSDMGKTEPAVAEAKKLIDGKNDREAYLTLAQIYEKAKNYPEMGKALDAAEKLSSSKDDKENIHFMRGAMYERMKNFTAAEAEFRKVIETNPGNSSALNYLGFMLADRNVRLPEAQDLIKRALEREPNNGAYLDSLGWLLFRMNRLPEAEEKLRQALEVMSKDPTVHDHLGDVYFHEGKIREAILQWQNSLKEWQDGAPSELDHAEVAKIQHKLDDAKVRLARETGGAKQP